MKKLEKVVKTSIPTRKPMDIINELETLKQNKKTIESREKALKDDLGKILEAEGTKDSKGSFKLILGDKVAQKQARKSVSINPDKAEVLFKELGIWKDVIETKEIINESLVEQAIVDEKLSMENLEEVTDIKVSYAIVIGDYKPEEEEMPEIQTTK